VTVRFQQRAEQAAPSAGRRRSGVAQGRRVDARAPPGRTADVALDSILEMVERRRLATAELRILLALLDREAKRRTPSAKAQAQSEKRPRPGRRLLRS
jgi:hypothetical protein